MAMVKWASRGRKTFALPQCTTAEHYVCNILTLRTHPSLRFPICVSQGWPRPSQETLFWVYHPWYSGPASVGCSFSSSRILPILSSLQMGAPMQKAVLPCLSLVLLVWSWAPGVQGQEFQFGSCRVKGVVFQELWGAFRAMKDIVVSEVLFWTQLQGLLRGKDNIL